MWKTRAIFCIGVFISFITHAQVGNEWIDQNQNYYKFKIGKTGFYRISRTELASAGFPVASVNSSKIQLFRNGEEVALNVSANADNTVDFIEFFAESRDGSLDAQVYKEGAQPHPYYSLFSDSASYFITYQLGAENGLRMGFSSDQNSSGLTPEVYHLEDSLRLLTNAYSLGMEVVTDIELSIYDEGEGWTGGFLNKNGLINFDFVLENLSTVRDIEYEAVVIGGNRQNHKVNFSAGPNTGTLTTLQSVQFADRTHKFVSGSIPTESVGAGGELAIQAFAEGFEGVSERVSIAYMRMVYPQLIQFEGEQQKIFSLEHAASRRAWMQIATMEASNLRAFDITDPAHARRFSTIPFSDRLEVVVSDVMVSNKIIVVAEPFSVGEISNVNLPAYDLANTNYLIITHETLRGSEDPISEYENYRESTSGGGFNVHVANIDDLFNLYSYGDPTPMAISNHIKYANSQSAIENVFIIGKGFRTDVNYYRGSMSQLNIPTFGLPGSDNMYTIGTGNDPELPGIPIGRLNATSQGQITAYLNKVKEMESQPYDDLFRKDFLHLSGGLTQGEINSFAQIVRNLSSLSELDFIGGRGLITGKQTNESVEFIPISEQVNEGLGYITFFGHSSGTVSDIEVGRVSDPSFGFNNSGKYPLFLVNGCDAGGIYGGNFTFGEDWILTANLGAIAFISHTSTARSSTLRTWSDLFYKVGFGDDEFIGKSIGEVMLEVGRRYRANDQSDLGLSQIRQTQLQGDPALRIFGADHPDYEIDNNSILVSAFQGNEILAIQDSFKIEVIVKNYGRSESDSLTVQVDQTFPDGSREVYLKRFERVLRQDTLLLSVPIDESRDVVGVNLLTVHVDPDNEQQEESETNNIGSIEVPIFSGSTFNLFPIDAGIVSDPEISFVWQSSNLLEQSRSYDLEFDTQSDYTSTNRRTFTTTGEVLLKSEFDFGALALPDTTTIYWRTRFTTPAPNESDQWVESSFTLISGSTQGWGNYEKEQIVKGEVSGVQYNDQTNLWEFKSSITPIDIFTFGADNANFTIADIQTLVDGVDLTKSSNTIDRECANNTFNVIVFDKESGAPYNPILVPSQDVLTSAICGRIPQRIYQFRDSLLASLDTRFTNVSFASIVDEMRTGDQMVMFNIGSVNYSEWEPEVIEKMEELGVNAATLSALTDGQPVIFFGRKGAAPGSATIVSENGTSDPITEQSIELQSNVVASFTSGTIQSKRIGPASTWDSFSYELALESADDFNLDLLGVTADGIITPVYTNGRLEVVDVSGIDPIQYPQLEISLQFSDEVDQTPPQLRYWQINFEQPADALLVFEDQEKQTVQEGEVISRTLSCINTSVVDFTDSLAVMGSLINQESGRVIEYTTKVEAPLGGDTVNFDVRFNSIDMAGFNNLIVEFSPSENETYSTNNRISLANLVEVKTDETNPIIDVTFDGFHILDGDVVSPNPLISVRMRDDNSILKKTDTIGFDIRLRPPGESSTFQRINFSDPRLQYVPASENQDFEVELRPGPLEDGKYGLQILAQDESGNSIREVNDPYEISFEVINESTITHFYPYPNPFSTSCRFVFTLTGSEVPTGLKIQIMTVSGTVVREITQDEIGPIRVGNNITSYAWDGRDHYGDQLANGVYFYKVFVEGSDNSFSHRFTAADGAFKNGFGKLYILR